MNRSRNITNYDKFCFLIENNKLYDIILEKELAKENK